APARIGKTGDTTAAGNAKTAAGKPAGSTVFTLKQTAAGGLEITPPAKFRWDDLDTVLVLE
ncbi:MAG: hypothetical protein LBR07_04900, partial [Puniceicoccales bacterium]|nr:hypothetical protein [Puniceicoccales bacterium]